MKREALLSVVSDEQVGGMVLPIRGHKVMLDSDLAALYQVETKNLNKAVQRNIERFPEDFMFQLTKQEAERLRFQTGTLKAGRGHHRKYLPYVFTEQGIAMLSSVLRSERAVQVNIAIMRALVSLRWMMRSQDTIKQELTALKRQYKDHDDQIKAIFLMIDEIIAPPESKKKRKIGFMRDNEE